eukprot:1907951-Amphidinium_carterae.2
MSLLPAGISALTQAKGAYAAFFDAMQTPTIIEQRLKDPVAQVLARKQLQDTRAACPEIEQFEMSQNSYMLPVSDSLTQHRTRIRGTYCGGDLSTGAVLIPSTSRGADLEVFLQYWLNGIICQEAQTSEK